MNQRVHMKHNAGLGCVSVFPLLCSGQSEHHHSYFLLLNYSYVCLCRALANPEPECKQHFYLFNLEWFASLAKLLLDVLVFRHFWVQFHYSDELLFHVFPLFRKYQISYAINIMLMLWLLGVGRPLSGHFFRLSLSQHSRGFSRHALIFNLSWLTSSP